MNVLIVEDSISARRLLRITFEHYHCTVVEAADGAEGLELARRHQPDIIISDALMPRMDGFQLLRALKADPGLKTIPFIFYSSTYTGEKEAELALSLGAEAFVAKPTEPEELWNKTCAIMKAWESRQLLVDHPAIDECDEQYLREYSRIVATKLEEKVHELEEALVQRQRAENALKEQELELTTIFENAPFIMMLLDGDHRVCKVNRQVSSLSGSHSSEMLGRRFGDALQCSHVLDVREGCGSGMYCLECSVRRTVADTFETGQSHHQVETYLPISVDGKEQLVTLLLSTTKVIVAHQAMVLLSLQDISAYKKLELQLHHAQRMESIGTLAGGIAHDFNNILTAIIGYGDITLMNMPADNPLHQNIEHMLEAAHRAACLAKDLLLFSRKQISDKRSVDLNEIVRTVEKFLLRVIGEDITCSITTDNDALPVLADAHQLEQVLMNLATNARDAMPNGGALVIGTERIELDRGFTEAHGYGRNGMFAVLTVTDGGTGMDDETRRQIFDPFFTTKDIGKGTGLGLSVVYGIVKQHDGYITVYSEPGQGTTFRVYLPLIAQTASEAKKRTEEIQPAGGTETILLAEDDESVRNMAVTLLRNFGYDVIVAVDGDDAVNKYHECRDRVKLLLFDMIMPGKNGKAAYDEIRAIDPDVRVIFTSGYATDAAHQKSLLGDNALLISKPYVPTNLLATVRSVLDKETT